MIVQDPNGFYNRQIAKEVQALGEKCVAVAWGSFDVSLIEQLDNKKDVVFFRTGAIPALRIARQFEERGFKTINDSRYIFLSAQKYIANIYAEANEIPIAELTVRCKKDDYSTIALQLSRHNSLVAKPIYSRDMGRYVFRVSNSSLGNDLNNISTIPGKQIIIQSEIFFEKIVRVIVLGNDVLEHAITYDTKHAPDWKATVCMNPKAKHYTSPPQKLVDLARHTNRVFGGDVAYIDYFEMKDGGFVLSEINHSCGLQHHEAITKHSIKTDIAKYLLSRKNTMLSTFV